VTATDSSIAIARVAARAAADKIAQDIVGLDVSERLALADVFLIASAPSERQVNAIVDGIEEELGKQDLRPVRREGRSGGRWVLLDYSDVVIHVQHEEDRVFYASSACGRTAPWLTFSSGKTRPPKRRSPQTASNPEQATEYARFGIFGMPVLRYLSCFGEIRTKNRARQ
jgi:ribosome-associated protein